MTAHCDNCGRPADGDDDVATWALLLLSPPVPDRSYQAHVCPRCTITLRTMLFTRWNGKGHSPRFRAYHGSNEDDLDLDDDGAGGDDPGDVAADTAGDNGPGDEEVSGVADPVGVRAAR